MVIKNYQFFEGHQSTVLVHLASLSYRAGKNSCYSLPNMN